MVGNEDRSRGSVQVSRLQRTVEDRLFNPLLRWLLRSRIHWLGSRWLLLVSYEGRRSGRRYTFPVVYAERNDGLIVVTPKTETTWWRNFATPHPCSVWLRGTGRTAVGEVVRADERSAALATYVEAHGLLGRFFGVSTATEPGADHHEDLVVVRFAQFGTDRSAFDL